MTGHNRQALLFLRSAMKLTNAMLQAAIDKAIEAGLLPKYARKDESAVDREVMRLVLQAALNASPNNSQQCRDAEWMI